MRIVWTRRATRHLHAAYEYWTAEKSTEAANEMLERIFSTVEFLRQHPELGRPGRIPETRELVLIPTPFLVVYRVKEGRIEVLVLLHGARKWPDHF